MRALRRYVLAIPACPRRLGVKSHMLLKDLDITMESSEDVVVVEVVSDYINLFPIPTHLYYKMQNITVIILKLYPPLSTETNIHPPIPTE